MSGPDRFAALMTHNAPVSVEGPAPDLTPALGRKLLERTRSARLFAHSYTLIRNLDHGGFGPLALLDFAAEQELAGLCIHIDDGGAAALHRIDGAARRAFARRAEELGLAVHLELSDTRPEEFARLLTVALDIGARELRVYARHKGPLSRVLELIRADLERIAEQAERHDLEVVYEQHEDLKGREIAGLLHQVGSPRLHALFDFGNMLNAAERPLEAFRALAPFIRQVHMKGVARLDIDGGWGQRGVPMCGPEDVLPTARMLYELLMLGNHQPQVIAFALEQEVGYVAPPMRRLREPDDPVIAHREPSQTPLDPTQTLERQLLDERRWACDQVLRARELLGLLADCALDVAQCPA